MLQYRGGVKSQGAFKKQDSVLLRWPVKIDVLLFYQRVLKVGSEMPWIKRNAVSPECHRVSLLYHSFFVVDGSIEAVELAPGIMKEFFLRHHCPLPFER